MKPIPFLSAAVALGLVACDTINAPISGGDFNPLLPPGSGTRLADTPVPLKPGDHVRAVVDNSAFFKQLPQGDSDADKTLPLDTPMKVIRIAGTYLQVELDSSGEVGYVPSVMVADRNARPTPATASPAAVQVYPPPAPLPAVDPAGLPPEGAIPTVMDPAGE
ncbi:MAG: hypothetical protein DVB26_05260 [Verrucomicrobia bacterium]|nr:MAG: hypothetical protein DVB26_05260 [Verrucomicrobiota bacterium]